MLRSHPPLLWAWFVALAIVALASAAVVDHTLKVRRMNDASVAAWYCAHRGTRCDEDKPDEIEDRWQQRERAYTIAIGVFVVAGGVAIANRRRIR
ncbi:MAG: hypothetical protein QOF27_2105 [Gaiellaceae bacterium]|nr:hypothetical protein [Gaiellaceae bacterium]